MLLNNKYKRWYYWVVDRARKRGVFNEYFEKHHVIPVCMGGTNAFWNIVKLTYREHFLVHWLLTKCVKEEYRYKMCKALTKMIRVGDGKRNVASWQYEVSRIANRKSMLGNTHTLGQKRGPETRAKLSKLQMGNKYWLGKKHREESKVKLSNSRKGIIFSEDHRSSMSKAAKERWAKRKNVNDTSIEVLCVETGEAFENILSAANKFGLKASQISECIKGKREYAGIMKYSGGLSFKRVVSEAETFGV